MLSFLRKNAGTWLIKVLLGSIVLVFIFWGVGSFRERGEGWAAKIDGEPISYEQYNQAYTQMVEYYRKAYGQQFNDDLVKMLNLRQKALEQLIDRQLMLREADRRGIMVTDEELSDTVRNMAVFQEDGLFSSKRYRSVLTLNRMTPEMFEASQRDMMRIEKLQKMLTSGLHVSEPELQQWFAWRHAKTKVAYVRIQPDLLDTVTVDDAEVRAYYDGHPQAFRIEEKRTVQYVEFPASRYASQAQVSDEDVRDYYESKPAEFEKPKTVEARHILFRTAKDASDADVEKARQKALDVLKQAREGKDFAELARKHSEDPAKANGGYLGAFKKEDMVAPFSEKAFSMQPGEISDPVRTTYGWHIIKVEKVHEAHKQSLEEATAGIRSKLKQERAVDEAMNAAAAFTQRVLDGKGFQKTAEADGLRVLTTEPFDRNGPNGIPNAARFAETAFSLEPEGVSDVVSLDPSTSIVMQLMGIEPEHPAEFDAVKEKAKNLTRKAKQNQEASKMAEEILKSLKDGKKFADIPPSKAVIKGETDFFEKNAAISGIGFEPVINHTAFSLNEGKPLPDTAIQGENGYYVIQFLEKKAGDLQGYETEKESIRSFLMNQKQAA
ncbi:MAG: SurA N-terminal domain-containing protein, partial [Thermodesulfobacteriota bacterium]